MISASYGMPFFFGGGGLQHQVVIQSCSFQACITWILSNNGLVFRGTVLMKDNSLKYILTPKALCMLLVNMYIPQIGTASLTAITVLQQGNNTHMHHKHYQCTLSYPSYFCCFTTKLSEPSLLHHQIMRDHWKELYTVYKLKSTLFPIYV